MTIIHNSMTSFYSTIDAYVNDGKSVKEIADLLSNQLSRTYSKEEVIIEA